MATMNRRFVPKLLLICILFPFVLSSGASLAGGVKDSILVNRMLNDAISSRSFTHLGFINGTNIFVQKDIRVLPGQVRALGVITKFPDSSYSATSFHFHMYHFKCSLNQVRIAQSVYVYKEPSKNGGRSFHEKDNVQTSSDGKVLYARHSYKGSEGAWQSMTANNEAARKIQKYVCQTSLK